jgi:bifunctional non-homologous end joining protein LigD
MPPDLTDDDRDRFERLRERLNGVSKADHSEPRRMTTFESFDPMLAETFDGDLADLDEDDWYAERKYDGTRLVLQKFDGEVKLYTRRHVERSETIPELTREATEALPDGLVLDGEVTFVDPNGKSFFTPIHSSKDKVETYDLEQIYFVFDLLVEDGEWLRRRALTERKERLHDVVPSLDVLEPIEAITTGFQDFYDELVADEEEGIVIKRRDSPYHLGTRSRHWRKVKAFTQRDVVAVGYTRGEGRRESSFGALVLTDGERYIGRVGSGFSERELELLMDTFEEVDSRPVPVSAVGATYQPIEPLVVSVKYQEVTRDRELRAPVYLTAKPDAPTQDVVPLET